MPISINDSTNPSNNNAKLNLIQILNTFAFVIRQITGQSSWKTPPIVSLIDLSQRQGEPGAKGDKGDPGEPGAKGDKGDKGDAGEPAPLDHQHAITQVEGLQIALDSKSSTEHRHAIAQVEGLQTVLETNLIPSPHPGFVSGKYYPSSPVISSTNNICSPGFVYYTYFYIPVTQSFTKIAFISNSSFTNEVRVRLGIYKVKAGLPTTLIIDAGIVSFTTTGTKETNMFSTTLIPGWYAIAIAVAPTNISLVSLAINLCNLFGSSSVSIVNFTGLRANLNFSNLPNNASLINLIETGTPLFWLKAA